MVAKTIDLPNIRKFFVPDPGYIMVDADLSGADAQVVAWEANDEDLKQAFRNGLAVHCKNARDIFPDKVRGLSDEAIKKLVPLYHDCKQAVHGTNYYAQAKTLAGILNWPVSEAQDFQANWFRLHPPIHEWHERVQYDLETTRTVWNKFGFRRVYFDYLEGLLPQALAWGPQSTVALTCNKGGMQVRRRYPWLQLLLQVHDSLIFQIPTHREGKLPEIVETLHCEIPYPDPLIIPWSVKTSTVSWGDCN